MDSPTKSIDLERKSSSQCVDSEIIQFTRDEEVITFPFLTPPAHPCSKNKLLRRFDLLILPPLAFIYLCNSLDRGNVANAKTAGWDKDIHLHGNQYYLLVMTFYIPFCLFGTPLALLAKRFSAARVIPALMIIFLRLDHDEHGEQSVADISTEVFAIRWFLGMAESPMLPAVVYYLSTFYKRDELASRIGLFYAASSISGAFSGLLSYGVFHINGTRYKNWQYLFWIEGTVTVLFAAFAFYWLPRTPSTWRMLSERQKAIARSRILSDSSTVIDEKVDVKGSFAPFKDPLYWVWILISISLGVPLASVNNFLPIIIASFKYSVVKTNLLTVAPNVCGTLVLLGLTFSSDYFRERSIRALFDPSNMPDSCIPVLTALVGFIVLGCIDTLKHLGVAYFACFLITMGAFAPSVLVATWYSNNTTQESKRAVVAAVMVAFANSAGLISTNVFRAQDEPKYVPALATSAAFGGLCFILVASTGIWMRRENARRNREQGVHLQAKDVDTSTLADGPKSPLFRYMY
ncbi:MFS general substrate transporter [Mycena kentingensis (nom. inval.)]|nr:MFS general substrate transporter [Mycena kentingensis (nom. inval.)]